MDNEIIQIARKYGDVLDEAVIFNTDPDMTWNIYKFVEEIERRAFEKAAKVCSDRWRTKQQCAAAIRQLGEQ